MKFRVHQTGITLVEVLLAAALAAFALLALALLHSNSLRAVQQAQHAVDANFLMHDLASRMQANALGRASYAAQLAGSPGSQGCSSTSSTAATACTPTQLAQHDAWAWKALLSDALGSSASATLSTHSTTDTSYQISVAWSENGEDRSASLDFRLRPSIP